MDTVIEVDTRHLFSPLDKKLIELLGSLSTEEWNAPTVASLWTVRDVASHLLDGNLRGLSASRDRYFGEKPEGIESYADLVVFLNELNMTWTKAARRISPRVLTDLLEITGSAYTDHLRSLDPFGDAVFSVAWAGQENSPNWLHLAREYTEKFLHQQQIRDAVSKPGIMTREFFYPFIDTLMFAFPYTFKDVNAEAGTVVSLRITTEIGGTWSVVRNPDRWILDRAPAGRIDAQVTIDPETAWKLFSKSWRPNHVMDKVEITGDSLLGQHVLSLVAVMA